MEEVKLREEKINFLDNDIDGKTDCFWCGREFAITEMQKDRRCNTIVYYCKDCAQP
jgi:CRISPR/Cas system-associated protein Cas10 (large subunit of type III CRISPR-Cas system)